MILNDLVTTRPGAGPGSMLAGRRGNIAAQGGNIGSISVEQERAVAEAIGAIMAAQSMPRDQIANSREMMESCKRLSFAEKAFYSYKRGGQTISGPSIRMAEELARCYGNIEYGMRELSRIDGGSEMQAFCIDIQKNVKSTQNFTVMHLRDKTGGPEALSSERDIYEVTANNGARRLRARILAVLPAWYVEEAIDECKRTLAGGNGAPLADRIKATLRSFEKLGVTAKMVETRLGHALDAITPDELVELHGVGVAIKDGATTVAEEFSPDAAEGRKTDATAASINSAVTEGKKAEATPKKDAPKAAEKPKPEPQDDKAPEKPAQTQEKAPPTAEEPKKAEPPPAEEKQAEEPATSGEAASPEDVF